MSFLLVSVIAAQVAAFAFTQAHHRLVAGVLLVTTSYFCVAGVAYWVWVEETYFVGVTWGQESLQRAALVLAVSSLALAAIICVVSQFTRPYVPIRGHVAGRTRRSAYDNSLFNGIALGGLACSLFVLVAGAAGVGYGAINRSPFFLIAFQAADMLIPAVLYLYVKHGLSKATLALIAYFVLFVLITGLRYKLAVLAIPLMIIGAGRQRSVFTRWLYVATVTSTLLAMFSVMTLFRNKFSGLDFSRDIGEDKNALFAMFAETNLLFGLVSILENYVDKWKFELSGPIISAVSELLPKFLFPTRTSGEYLTPMQHGLITDQGLKSGTTYPFVGEFLIMGGWGGLVLGLAAYAWLYTRLFGIIRKLSPTLPLFTAGIGLLAALMGYYHYSRGYLPQALKGYLFILLPYIAIIYSEKKDIFKSLVSDGPTKRAPLKTRRRLRRPVRRGKITA